MTFVYLSYLWAKWTHLKFVTLLILPQELVRLESEISGGGGHNQLVSNHGCPIPTCETHVVYLKYTKTYTLIFSIMSPPPFEKGDPKQKVP